MRSWFMETNDDTSTLDLREVPRPEPGPGQVLLKMHAAALNRGEFLGRRGLAKAGGQRIGLEGAGEIAAIGAGVTGLQVEQRVMGRCPAAFSEYAAMDVRELIPMPANIAWREAGALSLVYQVAYDLLVLHGRVQPSHWVLINGVSSGVGVASLQVAKAFGARVIGTSGSADKLERLRELGLDVPVCTRGADFREAVLQATGGAGVNMVVNNVGGSVFAEDVRCMAFQARLGMVGYVDGRFTTELDIEALHAKRLTFFGASNKMRTPEQRAADVPGFISEIVPAFADGRIKPVVDHVFPFTQLPAAREHMQADRHLGKIVLEIAP